jgi:endonuclease VIII-like 1
MPEGPEVKIMSDFINDSCKDLHFTSFSFPERVWDKNMGIIQDSDLQIFNIEAESRGKELMLSIIQGGEVFMKISCALGMTGNWAVYDRDNKINHQHAQMCFHSVNHKILSLIDVRRFAKWQITEDWSKKRGPDPMTDNLEFVKHIEKSINKTPKAFQKPICELMMDQKYFNGIGNYLRAEILYRLRDQVNPFEPAIQAIRRCPQLLEQCKFVTEEAYAIGGGELKDWDNPYTRGFSKRRTNKNTNVSTHVTFRDWLKCYQKKEYIIDSNKRKFWYDDRFKSDADIYINNKDK